jgi:hypothetical protein
MGLPEALSVPRLVGIHCWAAWNGHDYAFAKQLDAIRQAQGERIDVYSMDVEEPSTARLMLEWEVRNVPAFVVFQKGRRLRTFYQGPESVPELMQSILRWLEGFERDA